MVNVLLAHHLRRKQILIAFDFLSFISGFCQNRSKHHHVMTNGANFHFIFVGNDYKRKGLIPLLKALERIKDKDFHLSIIGKERNMNKYKHLAETLKIEKKVSFFGKRNDIINFYQIADTLIIPSFYDPFSKDLQEYHYALSPNGRHFCLWSVGKNRVSEISGIDNSGVIIKNKKCDDIFLTERSS